jgi:uncharacterized protein YjeT (DUF2065 family)
VSLVILRSSDQVLRVVVVVGAVFGCVIFFLVRARIDGF